MLGLLRVHAAPAAAAAASCGGLAAGADEACGAQEGRGEGAGGAAGLALIQGRRPPRVSALDVSGLEEEEEAAREGGACSFSRPPADTYVWDPACAGGGVGCRADGVHNECRWCGFAAYAPCSAALAASCTAEGSDPWATGSKVGCCGSLQECLGFHGTDRNFFLCLPTCSGSSPAPSPPVPAPAPTPAAPACTAEGSDPWATGSKVACCSSLQECLGFHGTDRNFFLCLPSCSAPSPTPPAAPAPSLPSAPSGGGGAGDWRPSGETLGSGHCRAEVPQDGWQLWSSCGNGPEVRVLSYNLFWWNLFRQRGGNGRSAGKLIQANGPFDIMGFQECEDAPRVLRDARLSNSHVALPGGHATAIAYRTAAWQELGSGREDVAEDRQEQYYGLRGAGWARLRHRQSGRTVFVVNHHGPLPVNTGGKCGGEATAYNLLRLAGRHAAPGDAVILLGDINADVNSATQQTLRERLHRLAHDWVDAVFASCPGISSRNLGNGGSDHNAIEAVVRL